MDLKEYGRKFHPDPDEIVEWVMDNYKTSPIGTKKYIIKQRCLQDKRRRAMRGRLLKENYELKRASLSGDIEAKNFFKKYPEAKWIAKMLVAGASRIEIARVLEINRWALERKIKKYQEAYKHFIRG